MSNSKKNLISSLICIIFSVATLVLVVFMLKDLVIDNTKWLMCIAIVVGIAGGMLVHIVIHELMHLLFGVLAGFKPYAFNLFGISFLKVNGKKIRKQMGKNANGFCSMYFIKTSKAFLRYGLFVFGGLFGSLLITTASFLVMFLCKNINPYIYAGLSVTTIINIYILLSNLIPSTARNVSNDGSYFFGILSKNSYTKLTCKALIVQGKIINGVKPREMDRAFVLDTPVVEDGATEKVLYQTLLYSYYLDCYTFNNADEEASLGMDKIVKSLTNSFEDIIDIYKPDVACLILFHLLKNDGDKNQIERFYEECKILLLSELAMDNLRVKMAYEFYYLKNYKLALITGKSALLLKDEFIYVGLSGLEEKLISNMLKECTLALAAETNSK